MRKGTKVTARDPDGLVIQRGKVARVFTLKGREWVCVEDATGGILSHPSERVETGHAPFGING